MKKSTILNKLILIKLISQKSAESVITTISKIGHFAIITVNDVDYRLFMFDMTEEDVIEFIKDFEPDRL